MEKELTVIGHLEELRRRVIISLMALAIATIFCVPFSAQALRVLKAPAAGHIDRLVFFSPEEAFLIYMKISLLLGFSVAFPVIAYQAWLFMAPAIEENLKRRASYFIFSSSCAFIAGCAFAYFIMLPAALAFLLNIGQGDLEPVISATRYISFIVSIIFACGLTFEMPVLLYLLARLGLIDAQFLRRNYKYAILAMCILAAVITPTGDAFNMMALALPMLFLFEISIWVVYLTGKRRR